MRNLSVIIPIYNEQAYVEQCIESILKQKYTDFELILVNDGSTDGSLDICKKYEKKDSRVVVIHQENQGVIKARINGALKSTSKYITFVDADDWINEDMYSDLMRIMEVEQVDMVLSGMYRYHTENKIVPDGKLLREGRYTRADIEKEVIPYMLWSAKKNTWELDPSLWSKIFRRELILKHLLNTEELGVHYGDDTSVVFPLMLDIDSMYVSHKIYYFHRQREADKIPSYFKDELYFDKLYKTYHYLKEVFENSGYKEVLQRQLDYFFMKSTQYKRKCYLDIIEEQEIIFPFRNIKKDAKVILYGAGEVGCAYMEQNEQYHFCNIVMWVDKNYRQLCKQGKNISGVEAVAEIDYDYIIIAVKMAELAKEVKGELLNMGVEEEKIVWNGSVIQRI